MNPNQSEYAQFLQSIIDTTTPQIDHLQSVQKSAFDILENAYLEKFRRIQIKTLTDKRNLAIELLESISNK